MPITNRGITYCNNWKYKLAAPHTHCLSISLSDFLADIPEAERQLLERQSLMKVTGESICFNRGYAWDGPSGPTIDTPDAMLASLVHDGLYQALRDGRLDQEARKAADVEFLRILKKDGMFWLRRWSWYLGVRLFASSAARPT